MIFKLKLVLIIVIILIMIISYIFLGKWYINGNDHPSIFEIDLFTKYEPAFRFKRFGFSELY